MTRMHLLSTVLPLALLAGLPAGAEVRALLVGVSDYHVLDADLRGPQNDVQLVAQALMARGADPALIQVLTTPGLTLAPGLAPPVDPTRAAILAALDALAGAAEPGDTIIFYYSGHGSQAPDQNGDEAGGYDEILLPSDSRNWKGSIGAVENAIVDDELQVKMQAILDKGAALVAIIDACHSATGFRALGGDGVARYVSPQSLGIPDALAEGAEGGHVAPPITGDFVFLYSSQSDQRSFEYPVGDRDDPANWYGDFTRNLTAVLTEVPDLSWRQALAFAADGLRQEQASQTPDGEGELDRPVFGAAGGAARMRVEGGRLMAGLLSGLAEGAVVEIWDSAAGGALLGTATLADVAAAESGLLFDGTLPATAYAELRTPGLPKPMRLALPEVADAGDYAAALAILAQIRAGALVDGLEWSDESYDMRIVMVEDDIALVGRDGVLDPEGPGSSPRIPALSDEDVILAFINRAVRLERLRTALASAEGRKGGLTLPGAGLTITGEVLEAGDNGAKASLHRPDCADPDGVSVVLKDRGTVSDCDQVWLAVRNGSRTAQDVTVLYVDRDMRVVPIWPQAGLSNRIAFGETVDIGMLIQSDGLPGGVEEIIVIAVPARDGAPRTDLSGLADPGATKDIAAASAVGDWLMAAADPDGARRAMGIGGKADPVKVTRIRLTLTGK